MHDAFAFLIQAVFSLYIGVVLMRLFLQWVRADFYNPLSQFVVKATNPLLLPLRRIIPGFGGVDLASLVLAYLLAVIETLLLYGLAPVLFVLFKSALIVVGTTFNLFFYLVIAQALLSWIAAGHNPAMRVLDQLTEPVLRPIRRVLPPIGGLDLSPLVFLLLMGFLARLLSAYGIAI
ncbi:MAG: YggT family protein [Gammaproteobacteria bacterium]|nr:YggT family protein [Gammaproteobacteria bacterium]